MKPPLISNPQSKHFAPSPDKDQREKSVQEIREVLQASSLDAYQIMEDFNKGHSFMKVSKLYQVLKQQVQSITLDDVRKLKEHLTNLQSQDPDN